MPSLSGSQLRRAFVVERNLPTIWCSGCGIGTVIGALFRAIDESGLDRRRIVFTVGIGCSGYASRYLKFDVAHTTHGRALAVATGLKLANPDLTVVALTGDGDGVGIGGNHFIHAARRNIGITNIIFNNLIYGMTGGQYSPTTPMQQVTTTSPYGMPEGKFDICRLAVAAGATYVARATTYHAHDLTRLIRGALTHEGFSVVEALCQCPTLYGRFNRLGTPAEMVRAYRETCVRVSSLEQEVPPGKIPIGLLHVERKAEFSVSYRAMSAQAAGG